MGLLPRLDAGHEADAQIDRHGADDQQQRPWGCRQQEVAHRAGVSQRKSQIAAHERSEIVDELFEPRPVQPVLPAQQRHFVGIESARGVGGKQKLERIARHEPGQDEGQGDQPGKDDRPVDEAANKMAYGRALVRHARGRRSFGLPTAGGPAAGSLVASCSAAQRKNMDLWSAMGMPLATPSGRKAGEMRSLCPVAQRALTSIREGSSSA